MAVKRTTPEDDYTRLAERLYNEYGNSIEDKESFNKAYDDYLEESSEAVGNDKLRSKAYSYYRKRHKISSGSLFKQAGGKDLARDRRTRAKTVVTDKREYKRLGARRVDLEGYDTPIKNERKKSRRLQTPAKVKGKPVYTSIEYVTVKARSIDDLEISRAVSRQVRSKGAKSI